MFPLVPQEIRGWGPGTLGKRKDRSLKKKINMSKGPQGSDGQSILGPVLFDSQDCIPSSNPLSEALLPSMALLSRFPGNKGELCLCLGWHRSGRPEAARRGVKTAGNKLRV